MRKVEFNGKSCVGEVVDFTVVQPEQWTIVKTPDGSVIKVKTHISEVIRVKDEFYENGEPAYLFAWTMSNSVVGAPGTQRDDQVSKNQIQ